MENPTIAFIGGGNMAASLIGGLIAGGWPADRIRVTDPNSARREALASEFSVHTGDDNVSAASECGVVVLAVKPQALREVSQNIAPVVGQHSPLIVSIAAGVREPDLNRWLGGQAAIVRTMPNTPAMVQSGATVLYANRQVTPSQRDLAESILRSVGVTEWVQDESLMDAVTALSGSGPAYFFLVMEAMEQEAIALGLTHAQAHLLTLQTALGAAKMAMESPQSLAQLRQQVTSPGGTTERALKVLEDHNLREIFAAALKAAKQRSAELADILGAK